eukprot:TRINITY_DN28835_c0_g1_i2.p1 TRINITY_DN28835_c0_g1~~TRINITY_DN28835_c0_g1_i2.p1  ORF type:complete len:412 (-),score=53.81 TRINITY_DN28835_c0_g1_i2:188-1423(-)
MLPNPMWSLTPLMHGEPELIPESLVSQEDSLLGCTPQYFLPSGLIGAEASMEPQLVVKPIFLSRCSSSESATPTGSSQGAHRIADGFTSVLASSADTEGAVACAAATSMAGYPVRLDFASDLTVSSLSRVRTTGVVLSGVDFGSAAAVASTALAASADDAIPCAALDGAQTDEGSKMRRRLEASVSAGGAGDGEGVGVAFGALPEWLSSEALATSPDWSFGEVAASTPAPRWHNSALSAGILSEDGHVLTKALAGPQRSHSNGMTLSSLCMLFERDLRVGGLHRYTYTILEGSVGAADGIGFVFDSRIRRTNIQRMRSVFLNKHGQVCIRNMNSITKFPCSLPKITEGVCVHLTVDLVRSAATFTMDDQWGKNCGSADISFATLVPEIPSAGRRSGFFCAIVTGSITVSLR